MAGRFSNTRYTDTVDSLLDSMKTVIKNGYYKYSDKSPTPVDYFHISKEASTLDEGSKTIYNSVGEDSPFRFNWIHNMILYGLEGPISLSYSQEEFGTEMASIEGEATILPNTIEPYPDDQFIIKHLNRELVFKITHVEPDTLENGANMYKISYRSSTSTKKALLKQTVDEFDFILANVGTAMNPIIRSSVFKFIKKVDESLVSLKLYYKRLFYNKRVQTFTFRYLEKNFYDPYMIEFLRKNNILEGDGEYIYIQHQTTLDPMFPMRYIKTVFECLERKDAENIESYIHRGVGFLIESKTSIFANRMEEYWEIRYDYPNDYELLRQIPCFKDAFIHHVADGKTLESGSLAFYNIIIKYFWDADINENDLRYLDTIDYNHGPTLYYAIPCIIYCLERCLDKLTLDAANSNVET